MGERSLAKKRAPICNVTIPGQLKEMVYVEGERTD